MADITTTLAIDHRHCDELFAEAEGCIARDDWERGQPLVEQFLEAMEHHFRMEEEVLFPTFEERTGQTMGPTRVMRMEHVQMRQLFADLREKTAAHDRGGVLGLSETLLMLMQQHNAKEEQILYRMADQALADIVPELLEQLKKV